MAVNTPTVVDGVVYITDMVSSFSSFSSIATVETLRATDGSTLWKVQNTGVTPLDSDTAPLVGNGAVYTGFTFYTTGFTPTGYVTALRSADGSQAWKYAGVGFGPNVGGSGATLAVANGVVYVGGSDGKVYALHE